MAEHQPIICVDIISQMRSLLSSFMSNQVASGEVFTHGDGFVPIQSESTVSAGGDFEANINDWLSAAFIGMMVLFLLFSRISDHFEQQRMMTKERRNSSWQGRNGPDSDVY